MSEIKFHSPSQILTEDAPYPDLNIMTGYIWSVGAEGGVFPSRHFIELNEYYYEKHFKELEHRLELAKEALESIAKNTCCTPCQEAKKVAEKALEQLK